jgi:hypothetical protein
LSLARCGEDLCLRVHISLALSGHALSVIAQLSVSSAMESKAGQRRIRLKCRYEGEIRTVIVTPETDITV